MSGRTRRLLTAVAALAVSAAALVVPATARADDSCTISWRGGVGSWSDATRWSPARVPTADDEVCVVRATGADPVSVKVTATTGVQALTLTGASLSVGPGVFLDLVQALASRAVVTGGGTVRGFGGRLDLRDTQLRGTHLFSNGGLVLGGQITFTGGTTIDASGFTDPLDGLRVVDGDGNTANHIALANFPLYLTGSVFVGVALGLRNVILLAQNGDVVLSHLDNLGADGSLQAFSRSTLQLGTGFSGSLTLPRTITSVGNRVSVFAGDLRTADDGDALRGVTSVDGVLGVDRTLVTDAPIAVRGRFTVSAPLIAPSVVVRAGASFAAPRVAGALTCGGSCDLTGARLGKLTVLPGARVGADATQPVTVDGTAALAGTLALSLPAGRPQPGATVVLLTASRGVTGTFDAVTTDRRGRTVTPDYRPTYVTGAIGAAA